MSEPCPNCGRDDFAKQIYVKEKVGEEVRTFVYCDVCPKKKVEQTFPAFVVNGSRNAESEIERKIENIPGYELRMRDHVDTLKRQSLVMCGYIGGERMKMARNERVYKELNAKLGYNNWDIKRDDGFEVVAEQKKNGV